MKNWIKDQLSKGVVASAMYPVAKKKFKYKKSLRQFRREVSEIRGGGVQVAAPAKKRSSAGSVKTPTVKRTLGDFKNQFDESVIIPKKIDGGIKSFLVNRDGDPCWMKDREFREACGVPVSKWRRYADEYKHLQVKVPGDEIVWGHPDIIEDMRRAVQR